MIKTAGFGAKTASFVLGVFLLLNSHSAHALKVGIVLDKGGKDDKSFNSAAMEGARRAKNELKDVTFREVEASDDNAFEPMLRSLASKDYDLVIGIGFSQKEAVRKIAAQFPNKKFAIVDAEVNLPNVRSLLFEEHQGSFLVGAIAARASKSKKVGFIGGMDIPLIRRFELGFRDGVASVSKDIQVTTNYVGVDGGAWNNPAKAKELALAQYGAGVDVIFAAAGASGLGVFDAAEEKSKFAIGVDSNQNHIKPGRILTSMLKRVDVAVFDTIKDMTEGKYTAGVKRYGLENDGVGYAVDQHNEKVLSADIRKQVEDAKKQIMSGKITVSDYYLKMAKDPTKSGKKGT